MERKLCQSINPLSYRGVNALQPPELTVQQRAPTAHDFKNFAIGTIWLNNAGIYLTPPVPPSDTDIWMLVDVKRGVATWVFFGSPPPAPISYTGDTGAAVFPDAALNTNLISGIQGFQFDGNPPISTITANTTTGILFQTVSDDSATKVYPDAAGDVKILGTLGHVTTTSSPLTNSISVNLDATISTEFTANDTHIASPVLGNLNVLGNHNIYTSVPAADTLRISLSGTTNHSLQIGNSTHSLTSLGVADNGKLPIGSTATDPVLNALTAGNGIKITNAAGSITIAEKGSGAPAFSAYITAASINNVTGDGTIYQIVFNVTSLDTTSSFNTTTGKYVIPVAGYYYFACNGSYICNGGGDEWSIKIERNGSNIVGQAGGLPTSHFVANFSGQNNAIDMFIAGIIAGCNIGDLITCSIQGDIRTSPHGKIDGIRGSNGVPGAGTYFCGYLLNQP